MGYCKFGACMRKTEDGKHYCREHTVGPGRNAGRDRMAKNHEYWRNGHRQAFMGDYADEII